MSRNETRLNELEQYLKPGEECMCVYYADWLPGKQPPDEEIEVIVTFYDNRKTEHMTMAQYKKRFPNWEEQVTIRVVYGDEMTGLEKGEAWAV